MAKVFNIQKNVNPHFKSVWLSNKPYNILKGGRNSFKSSVIALLLVYKMLQFTRQGQVANVIVIRKVGNTIRDSVYKKIHWALNMLNVGSQFKSTVSPFNIIHKKTGSTFYFYGLDDFQKLKSNDVSNIIAVWYEEAAEFKDVEEFNQTNITFMRQKHPQLPYVQFFWSYNPPRNPYSWINEWVESLVGEKDYLIHSSSYLDDELDLIHEQTYAEIERIKRNDYEYYRYLYLGEPVGLGTNVYNLKLFKQVNAIPSEERIVYVYFACDSGHQQSATTCLCLVLTNADNVYLIDTYYYSPAGKVDKKAPSELSRDLHDFEQSMMSQPLLITRNVRKRTIDSAEGALRNQYKKDYRIKWHPVKKKKKIVMTEFVQSLLAEGRFFYLPTKNNLKFFIEEHKKYQWDEKTVMNDDPKVIKEDDHTCDALQYFVVDNLKDLKLKDKTGAKIMK
ncbi:PBSX family phage terminase large subunit [Enterococcus cecorum]|uniref:PBSX family phage terminase large subunit n=1 Tax=Enterococcus cecorum TaxID=44008 RepID=UPI000DEA27EB|nr:PBSX family phage terminase large subunit [Enterococcus cecorum]RBR36042.1 PBSX family phage terminase, large subunit [Enterococcus cecorum]